MKSPGNIITAEADQIIRKIMKKGRIPGACIVIVRPREAAVIKCFGCADLKKKIAVTPTTLFELASCSKSFTGLAALQLVEKKRIALADPVSKYFPGFYVKYNDEKYDLTIEQLLHHTSGIPWETLALIPVSDKQDALEKTVKKIIGVELTAAPGTHLDYSSLNYDIIGAVIEKVTGKTFEDYMQENIFRPLRLKSTFVGAGREHPSTAAGYKKGLFFPGRYQAPLFRGNNPAAYIISNGQDIARWLKIQMGLAKTTMTGLIEKAQKPAGNPFASRWLKYSYAAGWIVQKEKGGEVFHTGSNPTFTSYIGFRPGEKIGAAVLANANSVYTLAIADYVISLLTGEKQRRIYMAPFFPGKYLLPVSFCLGVSSLLLVNFLAAVVSRILAENRRCTPPTEEKAVLIFLATAIFLAALIGVSLYPGAVKKINWRTLITWSSQSFFTTLILFLLSLGLGYVLFLLVILFPW